MLDTHGCLALCAVAQESRDSACSVKVLIGSLSASRASHVPVCVYRCKLNSGAPAGPEPTLGSGGYYLHALGAEGSREPSACPWPSP